MGRGSPGGPRAGRAEPVGHPTLGERRVNVGCGPAEQRLLLTGLHSVADIFCQSCKTTLGWKYVSAPHLLQHCPGAPTPVWAPQPLPWASPSAPIPALGTPTPALGTPIPALGSLGHTKALLGTPPSPGEGSAHRGTGD